MLLEFKERREQCSELRKWLKNPFEFQKWKKKTVRI